MKANVKQVRELTGDELNQKLADLKEEYFNLRFQQATGQLNNPMRIRDVRRGIAVVKTVIRARQLGV